MRLDPPTMITSSTRPPPAMPSTRSMISAVVSNRSPHTASTSARARVTEVRPLEVRTTTCRDIRALVTFGRFDVEHELAEPPLVVRDLIELVLGQHVRHQAQHQVEDALVDVGAAERMMPIGGEHRDPAAGDLQHGGVERPAAEVVDQHGPVTAGGQPVVSGGGHGLVKQLQDIESRDNAGLVGSLPLGEAEVRRNRDDGPDLPPPASPQAAPASCRRMSADIDSGVWSWPRMVSGNAVPMFRLISWTPFSGSTAVACSASSPTTTAPSGSK